MATELRLSDFINNDLKIFSNHDNIRSIPSIIDGFKDAQRKAVFGMLITGNEEIKLSQLAGICSLKSAYHHGEVSMCETLVGLAQNFPGSNNVNLLEPIGQFGSILSSQAAAARYIYTKPSQFMRKYIRKEDDNILTFREEEGSKLEPINYYPVLPMWLVNGSLGIGTGHSVRILNRDPKKVSKLVSNLVSNQTVSKKEIKDALTPHFNGWKGSVHEGDSETQWELHGVIDKVNATTLRVTELPVTYDVDKYKSILIGLMDTGKVKDFDNNSTEQSFDFVISVSKEIASKPIDELKQLFKLIVKVGENVTLWDTAGKLKKYDTVYSALKEFIEFRTGIYAVRKKKQIELFDEELDWLKAKVDFITYWNTKLVDPHKKSKAELETELTVVVNPKYIDQLLTLQIRSLTMEQIVRLTEQIASIEAEKTRLVNTSLEQLFVTDLTSL